MSAVPAPLRRLAGRRSLWLLGAASIVFGLAQAPELRTMSHHGASIVDFEFVRTTARAHRILSDWGSDGRSAARTSLFFDYAYLVSYALFLALACAAIAERALAAGRRGWARAGAVLAWAGLAAGVFDACENAFLLAILGGHRGQPVPALASVCATIKFACVIPALLYAIVGGVALALARRSRVTPGGE